VAASVSCNRNVGPRPGRRTTADHCDLATFGDVLSASSKMLSFGKAAAA
jgi:hypothetical protein